MDEVASDRVVPRSAPLPDARPRRIAILGATGNIGSQILKEALSRGHAVTGITRNPDRILERPNLAIRQGDTADPTRVSAIFAGHDVAVISVRWAINDVHQVLAAIGSSAVGRAIFITGASGLLMADGRRWLDRDAAPRNANGAIGIAALETIRQVTDFDWTAIACPAIIVAGDRTGKFRLGGDHILHDDTGRSRISREDFAVAVLDEIEAPKHIRRRFTVAY